MQNKDIIHINQNYLNFIALGRAIATYQSFFIYYYLRSYHGSTDQTRSSKTILTQHTRAFIQRSGKNSKGKKAVKKRSHCLCDQKDDVKRSYLIVFLEVERSKKNSSDILTIRATKLLLTTNH
jgi:hypothetical protein